MHSRVVQYTGKNINVTSHNQELRKEYTKPVSFMNTFNIGYEGFSKPWKMSKADPITGHRGEFLLLAVVFGIAFTVRESRKINESGVRSATGHANNRYQHIGNVGLSDI